MELLSGTSKKHASTLDYVDIRGIEDGAVILQNGHLRSVLLVSSINFDLKSSNEQDAIIGAYQNFLNSLDFPIQILISSRKLNISPYISRLTQVERQQRNELLRIQTAEYASFVENLTEVSNIMSKFFYIVVPFAPLESTNTGILDRVSSILNPKSVVVENQELFETYKNQLWQRVDHIAAALSGTGLHFTTLNTEELIELLYNSYNPSTYAQSTVHDVDKVELSKL